MLDCNNENQRAVRDFLRNEHIPTFGAEGDIHIPDQSDEDHFEVRRIDIGEKQDTILAYLKEKFDPFQEDNNYGINLFVQVKDEVLFLLQ